MKTNQKPTKETCQKWHDDPKNWKWGFIYFNREDPRIFPPKRFAFLGWTVNFANLLSVAVLVLILIFIVVLGYFSMNHFLG